MISGQCLRKPSVMSYFQYIILGDKCLQLVNTKTNKHSEEWVNILPLNQNMWYNRLYYHITMKLEFSLK